MREKRESRRKSGVWDGEDEPGQGKPNGLGAAQDGPVRDIIHESLAQGRAGALPLKCRQIAIDCVMDEESIDKDENAQMDL